jgi:hypothetical protein
VSHLLLGWLETGALLLAPAVALAVVLLLGRYPGEQLLARPGRRPRPRRRATPLRVLRNAALLHRSGGLLIAHSLAGRAPPALPL